MSLVSAVQYSSQPLVLFQLALDTNRNDMSQHEYSNTQDLESPSINLVLTYR